MNMFEAIEGFLGSHSIAFNRENEGCLSVPPTNENGFETSITGLGDEYVVHYGGWHEHISDPAAATNCFLLGLTPQVRVLATYRGHDACKWVLEYQEDGTWREDMTVGTIFQPLWKKAVVKELQNSHLTFDQIKEFSKQP